MQGYIMEKYYIGVFPYMRQSKKDKYENIYKRRHNAINGVAAFSFHG